MPFPSTSLISFAEQLLTRAGLDADKATDVAAVLVEGDLLGHNTHGLQLLPAYLGEIEAGRMKTAGEPRVLADFPAAITWDGDHLPGPWLMLRAIDLAIGRARTNGSCTVVIRRSHHLACLAAFLRHATDQGMMIVISCSDPAVRTVAPHGGREGQYSPNPIAAGWPTSGNPVLIDVSTSILSNGFVNRLHRGGQPLPGIHAVDASGRLTTDSSVLSTKPPGALLPIGGADHGHKGYGLGLLVEALTSGLAGHGRADPPEGWSANACLQVFDPALFGGQDAFVRQTEDLARACRSTLPREGGEAVRLPGDAGLRRREKQLAHGVDLHPGILPALEPWARKLGVTMPAGD